MNQQSRIALGALGVLIAGVSGFVGIRAIVDKPTVQIAAETPAATTVVDNPILEVPADHQFAAPPQQAVGTTAPTTSPTTAPPRTIPPVTVPDVKGVVVYVINTTDQVVRYALGKAGEMTGELPPNNTAGPWTITDPSELDTAQVKLLGALCGAGFKNENRFEVGHTYRIEVVPSTLLCGGKWAPTAVIRDLTTETDHVLSAVLDLTGLLGGLL